MLYSRHTVMPESAPRIGLNLLHLVPGETGGSELYARRLIPALLETEPSLRLTLFVAATAAASVSAEPWADEVEVVTLPVDARSRPRRVLAEQTALPRAVRRTDVKLLHNLFTTAPALPPVFQVTTILDVIYRRFPETHPGLLALGMRALVPLAARRSKRILTLSEASKKDIVRFLGVSAERVDVTYLGPGLDSSVRPVPEAEVRRQLELGESPIVLTVSAKRPHKNLERLLDAFGGVEHDHAPLLVVPGYPTPFESELRERAEQRTPGRVRFAGWVDDATLEGLYRAATCFVFPSLAEGFGLPVLEALARGLPVTCSNASSLPEIAGDAAIYFDPYDTNAITRSLEQLLGDQSLRSRLAEAGRERAGLFSWRAAAERTIESYRLAMRQS
jgi:glycosyltransferase involved in cell wall biosynthesis